MKRFKDRLLNIVIAVLAAATTALIITLYLVYPVLHLVYDIGRPVM